MATAFELAFLSNFTYTSNTGQSTRAFEIPSGSGNDIKEKYIDTGTLNSSKPGRSVWAIVKDVGLLNDMYCATYRNLQTNEIVFAFRGTRTNNIRSIVSDLAVDGVHLVMRNSPYIEAAKSYLSSNNTNNAIITGHSLGGFLAISMGFYFRYIRIASFNAPHVMSGLGNAIDLSKSILQENFAANKIICYNSTKDFASILTSFFGTGGMKMNNIKYENIAGAGFHGLEPMLRQLKKRSGQINWN